MQPYQDFRPSQFDSHIDLEERQDWLVGPCVRNRDSDCGSESNFQAQLDRLGGEGDNVELHRFGHWANGWFEIVLIRPNTKEAEEAEVIESDLESYPILNEDDWSEREQVAADEFWASYSVSERLSYIRAHRYQFEFHNFADMLGCVRGKYFSGYASELLG